MNVRNPYAIDPYGADEGMGRRGVKASLRQSVEMASCLLAMATLFFGMIYLLAKAGAR